MNRKKVFFLQEIRRKPDDIQRDGQTPVSKTLPHMGGGLSEVFVYFFGVVEMSALCPLNRNQAVDA